MFKNLGGHFIKVFAKILFFIEILIGITIGIIIIISDNVLFGFLIMGIVFLVSWIPAVLLYARGEMMTNAAEAKKFSEKCLYLLQEYEKHYNEIFYLLKNTQECKDKNEACEKSEMERIVDLEKNKSEDVKKSRSSYMIAKDFDFKFDLSVSKNSYILVEVKEKKFITSAEIPGIYKEKAVATIWNEAFSDCLLLEKVEIPSSVTFIRANAFKNCNALLEIKYRGTLASWKSVVKESGWDVNTGKYIINCIDGYSNKQ